MTYGAGYPTTEDRTMPAVVYVLYFLGLTHGLTTIIGLIIAYSNRSTAGPIIASHYDHLIRTFWQSLVIGAVGVGLLIVGGLLSIILIGIPFAILGGCLCAGAWVLMLVRCIIGAIRLADGAPVGRTFGPAF